MMQLVAERLSTIKKLLEPMCRENKSASKEWLEMIADVDTASKDAEVRANIVGVFAFLLHHIMRNLTSVNPNSCSEPKQLRQTRG